jgi:6-pyruvoyltetrahydropterin/6-carboxytetrahydropterin synthase
MGHYLLSAEATFSAAHQIPGVDMCDRVHGHNWRVRVTVRVGDDGLDGSGMGVDFRAIEGLARDSVAAFEHRHLNELEPFRDRPPTAERIARVLCDRITEGLGGVSPEATVDSIEVWEMPEYRVLYRP